MTPVCWRWPMPTSASRADSSRRRGDPDPRTEMSAQLTSISPQFLVDDLDAAVACYRDKLGFELQFTYEAFYAAVSRDGLSIHLKRAPRLAGERVHRRRGEHLDAYVAVKDVRALHRELE